MVDAHEWVIVGQKIVDIYNVAVIPAKAGTHSHHRNIFMRHCFIMVSLRTEWVPACAGMTVFTCCTHVQLAPAETCAIQRVGAGVTTVIDIKSPELLAGCGAGKK